MEVFCNTGARYFWGDSSAIAFYTLMALRGYMPSYGLKNLSKIDSRLQKYPDKKLFPGLDMHTSSLGQGVFLTDRFKQAKELLKCNWERKLL
ncbi:hypothetical protein [Priestia megaterium]|uniref:hypothetical protein n=1 Tax=Priestia megaterium TaxID=1404 RepID=UPI003A80BB23